MKLIMKFRVIAKDTSGWFREFTVTGDLPKLNDIDEAARLVLDIERKINELGYVRAHCSVED